MSSLSPSNFPPLPFAHPVASEVREVVLAELRKIEAAREVRILFACESGSRAWGFASPDSDYDVRFLYVHRLPWYLRVVAGRDVIELPLDAELDINGWELRKALGLLRKSNPTLLEWLASPLVYRADPDFVAAIRDLGQQHFSPARALYHYVAMAKNNFRGYLQGDSVRLKKYLYVLRPLLAAEWIMQGKGVPPMRFTELVENLVHDAALYAEIRDLLTWKMQAQESAEGARLPLIHDFVSQKLEAFAHIEIAGQPLANDIGAMDALLETEVLRFSAS